jgi:hypothetical protein
MPGFDMRAQRQWRASDATKAASNAMMEMKVLVGDWRVYGELISSKDKTVSELQRR